MDRHCAVQAPGSCSSASHEGRARFGTAVPIDVQSRCSGATSLGCLARDTCRASTLVAYRGCLPTHTSAGTFGTSCNLRPCHEKHDGTAHKGRNGKCMCSCPRCATNLYCQKEHTVHLYLAAWRRNNDHVRPVDRPHAMTVCLAASSPPAPLRACSKEAARGGVNFSFSFSRRKFILESSTPGSWDDLP